MNLIDALLGEHGMLRGTFVELDQRLSMASDLRDVGEVVGFLTAMLSSHAEIEETLLFPEMKAASAQSFKSGFDEHTAMNRVLETATHGTQTQEVVRNAREAIRIALQHFQAEERTIFPEARELLGTEKLAELGAQWAKARSVAL